MRTTSLDQLAREEKDFLQSVQDYAFVRFNVCGEHIESLSIGDIDKDITINSSIKNLSRLKSLAFPSFKHVESLPKEIAEILTLRHLLKSNIATEIPGGISQIPLLSHLHVNLSQLVEFLEEICQVKTVEELMLENLKIHHLPDCIGNLINLCRLSISYYNNLRQLPDSVSSLKIL